MSHERLPSSDEVQQTIATMQQLIDTERYSKSIAKELSYTEMLDFLGEVTSGVVDRCNDNIPSSCVVFLALNALYKGGEHHAAVVTDLIQTGRLDVSGCNKNWCMLKSIQRYR